MWLNRFQEHLRELLVEANHPGIARIETHYVGKEGALPNLKIIGTDGVEISLLVTRTSAAGDKTADGQERITTKADLAQIE